MLKTAICTLTPYLRGLDLRWTAVSILATLLTGLWMRRHQRRHIPAVCFTVLYLCMVYTSTVLSRMPGAQLRVALKPFWSYGQWMRGNVVFGEYIVLNILMLLPIGVSLSFLWKDWKRILRFGFLFSCLVEVSQLLSGRGLFEIDDIIHNTAGVALGMGLHTAMGRLHYEYLSHRRQGHGGNRPVRQPEKPAGRQEPDSPRHPD